ncbi:MAG: hypothetical protein HC880_04625 [Bacteroidia bacterium]|nr:hypothetical protein [Bacteroidia bacterium]
MNYIPWKKFGFKEAWAFTIKDNPEFDNARWNQNLENKVGKSFQRIEIEQNKIASIADVKDVLKKFAQAQTKPIFWNITGGQRPFLMAVLQLLNLNDPKRSNDRLCYLEGNTNRLVIMRANGKVENIIDYKLEGLTIETALKLMGFDMSGDGKGRTEDFTALKNHKHRKLYADFLEEYRKKPKLRKYLISTNKPDNKDKAIAEIEKIVDGKYNFILSHLKSNETYPFGYILEYMTAFTVLNAVENEIADMSVSTSLNFTNEAQQKATGATGLLMSLTLPY